MKKMEDSAIVHIGVVVPDAKKAAEYVKRVFGIEILNEGPFGKLSGYENCNTMYMGKPTDGCGYNYVFRMGQIEIEFIQPIDGPSTWQEYLEQNPQGGVHHIAWLTSDTDKTTEFLKGEGAAGMPISTQSTRSASCWKPTSISTKPRSELLAYALIVCR